MNDPSSFEEAGFVSVLIVNWNTRAHLQNCLESLSAGALQCPGEVIVVDNDSVDGSADMVASQFPEVVLLRNTENLGFAKGVNQAASRARGDLLLFLNSDTILEKDTISLCREYLLAHEDIGVVGCRMAFSDGRPQSSTFRFPSLRGVLLTSLWVSQAFPGSWYLNWDRYGERKWSEARDVDVTMGSFLLLRRSAIGDDPPLDEGYFMYGEEADMCRRLLSEGWRTVHFPDAHLIHVHGGSTKTPQLEGWAAEAKARGILRFFWKWRGRAIAYFANLLMLFGLFPRLLGWGLADSVQGLKRGKFKALRLHKGRALWFHLAVLFRPRLILSTWSGPNAIRSDNE